MPPPDWARVTGVESRAQSSLHADSIPVGDPIRWGGTRRMDYSAFVPELASDTIVRTQSNDPYSRLWSAIGNVSIRQFVWGAASAADLQIVLQITQGVGQARAIHEYDLRLLTTIGLTVYKPRLFTLGAPGAGVYEERPFAIIGGILGQALEGRIIIRTTLALGLAAEQSYHTVMIAPFAPGAGV